MGSIQYVATLHLKCENSLKGVFFPQSVCFSKHGHLSSPSFKEKINFLFNCL